MAATLQGFLQNCMTEHVVVHFLFHQKTLHNLLFFLIFEKIRRFGIRRFLCFWHDGLQ